MFFDKSILPTKEQALPGRADLTPVPPAHYVNNHPLQAPFLDGFKIAVFGLGCFWGAERKFWQLNGVYSTAVGYTGGFTPNPTYEEVCSGQTGHNEVVMVVYDPSVITFKTLLITFWESHNPTQGMQQGNDKGTQYRSGVYCSAEDELKLARKTRDVYQKQLTHTGFAKVTTEILPLETFYYAEAYHQQYLAKNPDGYCGLGGTNIDYAE